MLASMPLCRRARARQSPGTACHATAAAGWRGPAALLAAGLALAVTVAAPVWGQDAGGTGTPLDITRQPGATAVVGGGEPDPDASAPAPAETVVISEAEARVCAARLEPLAASVEEPTEALYLQRLGPTAFRVWAPRAEGPNAPLRPWCVTTLTAIAETSFLNMEDRGMIMELVAGAGLDAPVQPDEADGEAEETAPTTVIVEDEADNRIGPLAAAAQRMPPRGGRSAVRIGVPVPARVLPEGSGAMLARACLDEPGQPTAVFDRHSGRLLDAECRLADGSSLPLPALASELGAR